VHLTMLLSFNFESCLTFHYDYALSLYKLYATVVTLKVIFLFIFVNPILGGISLSHAMLRY
jgi:hypothetical protein